MGSKKNDFFHGFFPRTFGKLYNFPIDKYTGKNQRIGIIIFNCKIDLNVLNHDIMDILIKQNIHIMPNINFINIDQYVTFENDSLYEIYLDTQIIASIAPESTINIYNYSKRNPYGLYNAIKQAISDCDIISISLGYSELLSGPDYPIILLIDNLLETAKNMGINVFVATGDTNAPNNSNNGRLNVSFPASSPNVIACGGTMLNIYPNTPMFETVWNNGREGTGGGFSTIFKRPSYQNNHNIFEYRGIPDISANADPNNGYIICMNNVVKINGGTSAVAPLMAGLNALLNEANNGESIGFFNDIIYLNPSVCIDITDGNNCGYIYNETSSTKVFGNLHKLNTRIGYVAKNGWDPCTGVGRINGEKILDLILTKNKNIIFNNKLYLVEG
jgi:kumamolisin